MTELKSKVVGFAIGEGESVDNKCKTCEYYETCLKDPEFNEDNFNGCPDYVKKKNKISGITN